MQSVPTMMASMCAADVSCKASFRVDIYATDVATQGFTVYAEAWLDIAIFGECWMTVEKVTIKYGRVF